MRSHRRGRSVPGSSKFGLFAGAMMGIAGAAASASTISMQDMAELAGVAVEQEERWFTHLVAIPDGHRAIRAETGFTSKTVAKNVLGLRTTSGLEVLDNASRNADAKLAEVKQATKGGRVVPRPSPQQIAEAAAPVLLQTASLVSFTNGSSKPAGVPTQQMLAMATTLHSEDISTSKPTLAGRMEAGVVRLARAVPTPPMPQPNAQLIQLAEGPTPPPVTIPAKRRSVPQIDLGTTGSVTTAYAPQLKESGGPFDVVLREEVEPQAVSIPKERPEAPKIALAISKDDHKWVLNPLPKQAYSAAERRCLAVGVYFEARGEPVKGQQAVAQVIINRVKNPAYPGSICGVVYQNKWKRNRCQFSFACDGIRDKIRSPKHWEIASKVADDAIDGRVFLKSVGSSSHYHADYVRPRWRRNMKRLVKIGRHIFYRTYNGGWS